MSWLHDFSYLLDFVVLGKLWAHGSAPQLKNDRLLLWASGFTVQFSHSKLEQAFDRKAESSPSTLQQPLWQYQVRGAFCDVNYRLFPQNVENSR